MRHLSSRSVQHLSSRAERGILKNLQFFCQIQPTRIHFCHQLIFFLTTPLLKLFLSGYSRIHILTNVKVNKLVDIVFLCETLNCFLPMFFLEILRFLDNCSRHYSRSLFLTRLYQFLPWNRTFAHPRARPFSRNDTIPLIILKQCLSSRAEPGILTYYRKISRAARNDTN